MYKKKENSQLEEVSLPGTRLGGEDAACAPEGSPPLATDYSPLFGKTLLLDGDIMAWRAAAVAEKVRYLVLSEHYTVECDSAKEAKKLAKEDMGEIWTRKDDKGEAFAEECLTTAVNSLLAKTKSGDNYVIYLTSPGRTFRHNVAVTKPYKGNREYLERPKHLKFTRDLLVERYQARFSRQGLEADDSLGIHATRLGEGCFIASIDKDLDQIPGWHFNWVTDRVYRVSRKDGDFKFYTQLLTGDSTDNVPGIDGIGPQTAAKILQGAKDSAELFQRVWDVYRSRVEGSDSHVWEYMREQGDLLYILRESYNPGELEKWWPRDPTKITTLKLTETPLGKPEDNTGEWYFNQLRSLRSKAEKVPPSSTNQTEVQQEP